MEISSYDSLRQEKNFTAIDGIPFDEFHFPEDFGTDDVAKILAQEEFSDLGAVLECLKEELGKQKIKFTFTLKNLTVA